MKLAHFSHGTALTLTLACLVALPSAAHAQSAPDGRFRDIVDDNGVDLVTGKATTSGPSISIGNDENGLIHRRYRVEANADDYTAIVFFQSYYNINGIQYGGANVTIGAKSQRFPSQNSGFGNVFSPQYDTGDKLSETDSEYIYTSRDGMVINFSKAINTGYATASATKISYPNGKKITITYKQASSIYVGNVIRVQSVNSNTGYQLKYRYADSSWNESNQYAWGSPSSVTALNSTVDYCNPSADNCIYSRSWPEISYSSTVMTSAPYSRINTMIVSGVEEHQYVIGSNGLISIRNGPSGSAEKIFSYGSDGRVSSYTSPVGVWNYGWITDNLGDTDSTNDILTVTRTDPLGHQIVSSVSPASMQARSVIDELGRKTIYGYSSGNVLSYVVFPEGSITGDIPTAGFVKYLHDSRGNITETRNVAKSGSGLDDIVVSAGYDITCINYVTCNRPQWTKDAKGNQTDFTYDGTHGGILTVTSPAAGAGAIRSQTRFFYSPMQAYFKNSSGVIAASGQNIYVLRETSTCRSTAVCAGTADEFREIRSYGSQGSAIANNLLAVEVAKVSGDSALSSVQAITYDEIGNATLIDGPLPGAVDTTRTVYDAFRRPVGMIGPDPDGVGPLPNAASRTTYDLLGRVSLVEAGKTVGQSDSAWAGFVAQRFVSRAYNNADQMLTEAVGSGSNTDSLTQYGYDAEGRVECAALRMNRSTYASLPSSACNLAVTGPDGPDRITKLTYDASNKVTLTQGGYATSAVINEGTSYTPNGKIMSTTDAGGNRTTYAYDGHDRLSKTSYPVALSGSNLSSSTDFEEVNYDYNSNITAIRFRDGITTNIIYDNLDRVISKNSQAGPVVSYVYDLWSMITEARRQSDGSVVSYLYDSLGRLVQEGQPFGGMGYQYDASGRATRLIWNDGFYVEYVRDNVGRLTEVRENGASSGLGLLAAYVYDDRGFRAHVNYGNGTSREYAYNEMGRLDGLKLDLVGTAGDQIIGKIGAFGTAIGYNPASQINAATRSNDSYAYPNRYNVSRPYVANGLNQYSSAGGVSFGYNGRGSLTASGDGAYAYDSENRLVSAPGVALKFDAVGRLAEYVAGGPVRSYYSGGALVAEVSSSSGAVLRRFVPGAGIDEPIVWYEGTGVLDRRWLHADERGSIIAVTDASGSAININSYDEYGIPASGNMGRFGYTGQAWYPEIGLYNYKTRFYSPTTGRFMQVDPVGYGDGYNMYSYVSSDPVNKTDPTGLMGDANNGVAQFIGIMGHGSGTVTYTNLPPISLDLGFSIDISGGLMSLGGLSSIPRLDFNVGVYNAITPGGRQGAGWGRRGACKIAVNADKLAGAAVDPTKVGEALNSVGFSRNEQNGALGAATGLASERLAGRAAALVRQATGGIGAGVGESAALAARTRGASIALSVIAGLYFSDEISAFQQKLQNIDASIRNNLEKICRGE